MYQHRGYQRSMAVRYGRNHVHVDQAEYTSCRGAPEPEDRAQNPEVDALQSGVLRWPGKQVRFVLGEHVGHLSERNVDVMVGRAAP